MIQTIVAVRERISKHQAILYLLSKPSNQEKFRRDPILLKAIEAGDVDAVKNWFKDDLESMRLPELRNLAGRMGIYPVYGKTRDQLVDLIKAKDATFQGQAKRTPRPGSEDTGGSGQDAPGL